MAEQQEVSPQSLWIIWGAMLTSIAIYAGVALFAAPPPPEEPDNTTLIAIAATAIGPAVMWVLAPRLFKNNPFQVTSIIRWAFGESIAIFGLVTKFLGGPVALMAVLMAWGAVLIALSAPTAARRQAQEG